MPDSPLWTFEPHEGTVQTILLQRVNLFVLSVRLRRWKWASFLVPVLLLNLVRDVYAAPFLFGLLNILPDRNNAFADRLSERMRTCLALLLLLSLIALVIASLWFLFPFLDSVLSLFGGVLVVCVLLLTASVAEFQARDVLEPTRR